VQLADGLVVQVARALQLLTFALALGSTCMFSPTLRRSFAAIMSANTSSAPFSRAVVRAMQKL
jgi:hypothetical protein